MIKIKNIAAIASIALLASGCASVPAEKWRSCAIAGGVIGGAAGVLEDGEHDERDGAIGAVAGALIGGTICALMADEEPAPTPVVETVAVDTDGDGVVDSLDQCPGTPAGTAVDAKGCALDTDGDGVADYKDKCPNTAAGVNVNELGCAAAWVLRGVNFETNSAKLQADAVSLLEAIDKSILDDFAHLNLIITGHTDSTGSAAYNKELSVKRAQTVRDFMVSEGISASNLSVEGYGEEMPVADNKTAEGRAENRRVEISVKP